MAHVKFAIAFTSNVCFLGFTDTDTEVVAIKSKNNYKEVTIYRFYNYLGTLPFYKSIEKDVKLTPPPPFDKK